MTHEEAINEIKSWDFLKGKEIEAIHTLIPELRESEDERMAEMAIKAVRSPEAQSCIKSWGVEPDDVIAWLEKQKYDRMKPIYDARESFESALEKAWNDYHNGYENVDKLEDDYVECAHAKGFREGYLFGIEKQKEQKPIQSNVEKEYIRTIKSLISDFLRGKHDIDTGYYQKIYDWLDERHVEPNPAEWSEKDEETIHEISDYLEELYSRNRFSLDELNEKQRWLKSLRPQSKQEWGEDDEKMLDAMIDIVSGSFYEPLCPRKEMLAWLKSLRPSWKPSSLEKGALRTAISILTEERGFHKAAAQLQNSLNAFEGKESRKDWKPSEEQMKQLHYALTPGSAFDCDILNELYIQLKKLK